MTIGIAALMYAWMTGLFNTLSSSASKQAIAATQNVEFSIPNAYFSSSSSCQITAIIYNSAASTIPFNVSLATYELQEYDAATDTLEGTFQLSPSSSGVILPGRQETVSLSPSSSGCSVSNTYTYQLIVTYQGVTASSAVQQ